MDNLFLLLVGLAAFFLVAGFFGVLIEKWYLYKRIQRRKRIWQRSWDLDK